MYDFSSTIAEPVTSLIVRLSIERWSLSVNRACNLDKALVEVVLLEAAQFIFDVPGSTIDLEEFFFEEFARSL